ncbi:MAG: ABC transporter substrate-binding protein [Streptosporangiales bacterium]|nr:ABC transporter substrate-binding protein [Streptosporangiales bacterium]MBO0889384.1 ABC transporter substrate-binding protein [Acidothermales bacterium]
MGGRQFTRIGVVLLTVGMLAACGNSGGGGGGGSKSSSDAFTGRGPITLATGKDTSGNLQNQVNAWNKAHPSEKARIIELPEDADSQRQQMVQNAQTKSDAYTVLNLDVINTAEFAGNQWVLPIPKGKIDTSGFLPPALATATYFGKEYAVPWKTDGALLYYRSDLLKKAGISSPPKTWSEMQSDCTKVLKQPGTKGMSCYAGQFDKYEGLTCNFSEAVNSAGGEVINAQGKPDVDTPAAKKGLDFLVNGFKSGSIPKAAITYQEEPSRRAFQTNKLVFMRNWPYADALMKKEAASKVKGKFDVAPIPGLDGPGVSTLGGHNLAISAFAKNKASALDFVKYLTTQDAERKNLLATSEAPTIASLYDDQALVKKFPYLPILKQSVTKAKPRPQAVQYGDVTAAIEENAYDALQGKKTSDQALKDLQAKLQTLIK